MAAKREADLLTYKIAARDITDMKRTVRVLSLPGESWTWERGLADIFAPKRFRFTGVERDAAIFRKAKKEAACLGRAVMYEKPCDVATFLKTTPDKDRFDIIYFDWMSSWSNATIGDLDALFTRPTRLSPGGLLILTLALTIDSEDEMGPMEQRTAALPFLAYDARGMEKDASTFRMRGIPQDIVEAAAEGGVKLRPLMSNVFYFQAESSKAVTPHVQFMFLREG